jgi:hypothetical protein
MNDMPLYKVKALFDGLVLADVIDFGSKYGEFISIVLNTKRKDVATKHIIYVRSILETMIKNQELENAQLVESQKEQDSLAIESTCVIVTSNGKSNEVQLQLTNMPKKIGRPKSENALSGAERSKRARDKKKANKLVTVNSTLSKSDSERYNRMISDGYSLSWIIDKAYAYSVSMRLD